MPIHELGIWIFILQGLQLILFALALGLTLVSFQAYRRRRSKRLETAFIGFAFISMGIGLNALATGGSEFFVLYQIVETVPFIIGFGMLYLSLYR